MPFDSILPIVVTVEVVIYLELICWTNKELLINIYLISFNTQTNIHIYILNILKLHYFVWLNHFKKRF